MQSRIARIETAEDGTGRFNMVLATEGEASDGDILSVAGARLPARMPLLISHVNDPRELVGNVDQMTRELDARPPRIPARGNIELGGDEGPAAVRRDLFFMISRKHITDVSVRWDPVPGKAIRRVNLPSDHPHFVDAEKAKGPERWGVFFTQWRAVEGSIVALGADAKAKIGGRAMETQGDVRDFWQRFLEDPGAVDADPGSDLSLSYLSKVADILRSQHTPAEILNAVVVASDDEDFEPCRIDDTTLLLPARLARFLDDNPIRLESADELHDEEPVADPLPGHDRADPPATGDADPLAGATTNATPRPCTARELTGILAEALGGREERIAQVIDERIARALGRTP